MVITVARPSSVVNRFCIQELRPLRHALAPRFPARLGDEALVDFHAEAARAVFFRRRDDDAPVARAEIDDVVLRPQPGKVEHRVDHGGRRRHEGNFGMGMLIGGRRP